MTPTIADNRRRSARVHRPIAMLPPRRSLFQVDTFPPSGLWRVWFARYVVTSGCEGSRADESDGVDRADFYALAAGRAAGRIEQRIVAGRAGRAPRAGGGAGAAAPATLPPRGADGVPA